MENYTEEQLQAERELLNAPWVTIKETADHYGISEDELMSSLELNIADFVRLKQGRLRIGVYLALLLNDKLKIDAEFWLNLDKNYIERYRKFYKMLTVYEVDGGDESVYTTDENEVMDMMKAMLHDAMSRMSFHDEFSFVVIKHEMTEEEYAELDN